MISRNNRFSPRSYRRLSVESLENRNLLAAEITSVELSVGGTTVLVDENNDWVRVAPNDEIQIASVSYSVDSDMDGTPTFEAYMRKGDDVSQMAFDYSDAIYGGADPDCLLDAGDYEHEEFDGQWQLTEFADRIVVSLIRYNGDDVSSEARFYIKLVMGKPNFVITETNARDLRITRTTAGEPVSITGTWANQADGTFQNYAEVDVYHILNRNNPVWVGTLSGIAGPGGEVRGEFLNSKDDDAYDEVFVPSRTGLYILHFTVDPENLILESNEDDNEVRSLAIMIVTSAGSASGDEAPAAAKEDPPEQEAPVEAPLAPPAPITPRSPSDPGSEDPDQKDPDEGVDQVLADDEFVGGLVGPL